MPFGAEVAGGGTRFRLWAPASRQVTLELDGDRAVPMEAQDGGWHGTHVEGVGAGASYAFRLEGGARVPDPASRHNARDAGEASVVVDPGAFDWTDDGWRGRPWHEAVIYEMHFGTFTEEGTFASAIARLDHLAACGITAIEVMPVADFAGTRNWGYDGVLPFAPDAAYGTPEDFKRFVVEAHARGLMVLLDVVYNHFGPEGNFLKLYAPQFFNERHQTPWGAAINFDAEHSSTVRDFFVHNALYWIEEYHLDGLRLDAVHAIADDSDRHIVHDIARAVAEGPGRHRPVHLVLENDRNEAHHLERGGEARATAQWNDDWHHAMHVLVTGEKDGYYGDYAPRAAWLLARSLAEGFAYQGEPSAHHAGEPRGQRSSHLPPEAFIAFLQNHDQVGNRALGERMDVLADAAAMRLARATLLLAPSVPLLFMGEEFGARTPFLYFCDFHGELASAVREGRRKEFSAFARFADAKAREAIPDPNARETFAASKLRWQDLAIPAHAKCLESYRTLLGLRAAHVVPRLGAGPAEPRFETIGASGVCVDWKFADGSRLAMRANFSPKPLAGIPEARGSLFHREGERGEANALPAWGGVWALETV